MRVIDRRHGVQAQQVQTGHAKMHAVESPIVQACHAQRTSVANALRQNLPRMSEIVAVLPRDHGQLREMLRFGLPQSEWNGGFQFIFPVSTDLVYQNSSPAHPYFTL